MDHHIYIQLLYPRKEGYERRHARGRLVPTEATVEKSGESVSVTLNGLEQGDNLPTIWLTISPNTARDLARMMLTVADGSVAKIQARF